MSRTVNFGQSVSEKGIDPGETLSPRSLFALLLQRGQILTTAPTRMWISPWACWDPRAEGCSEQVRSPGASFLRSFLLYIVAVVASGP